MRRMEVIGVVGGRFSLADRCLRLVGVEADMKRREKPSGASTDQETPLQTLSGPLPYPREVAVRQPWPGDDQGLHTLRTL